MFGSLKPESFLIYSELESGHASFQHVDPHEKQWQSGIKPKESTWKRHLEQRRKRTNAASIKLPVDHVPKVGGGGGGKLVPA